MLGQEGGFALEAPPTPSSPLPKPCTNPIRKLANQTKLQWERSHEGKKHGAGQGKAGQRQLEKPRRGRALPFSLAKVEKFSSAREATWQLRRFLRPSPASFPNSLIGPNAAASPALVPACLQLRRSDGGLGLGAGRRGATPAPAEPVSAPGEEEGRGREASPTPFGVPTGGWEKRRPLFPFGWGAPRLCRAAHLQSPTVWLAVSN